MATTPTMGRPTIGRPSDSPDEVTKRRLYWGIALAVIILIAIGLTMRTRNNRISLPTETGTADTTITTPNINTDPLLTNPVQGTGAPTIPPPNQ